VEFRVDGKRVFAASGGRDFDPALPAAVFIHGAGMDHTVWALQTRSFAHRGRSVLALDLPGHGRSEGPSLPSIEAMGAWILAALDAAGAARARIAGHSMGSLVALEAAAKGASRVEGLALLGFAPEIPVHPDLLRAARAGEHAAIEMMVAWSFGARTRFGGTPAPGLWLSGEAMRLLERAPVPSLAGDLAACDAYRGAAQAAAAIRCPTLFVLGEEDRMTPAAKAAAFAERIAGAEIVRLAGVGHMMPIEDPVATLAALRRVL
jgi:pimeloyl-ACP methyl ester carboxylesterase